MKEGPDNIQDVVLDSNISLSKSLPVFATDGCAAGIWKPLSSERESPVPHHSPGLGYSSLMEESSGTTFPRWEANSFITASYLQLQAALTGS